MSDRNRDLSLIHIAKKQLGMDDDIYRDFVEQVTGKRSSADLDEKGRAKLIDAFKEKGFVAQVGSKGNLENSPAYPYLAKLRALWISGYYLGVVKHRSDKALFAFITRMTGLDHPRFLIDGDKATIAIEALRKWLEREAKVDWEAGIWVKGWDGKSKLFKVPQLAICRRLWKNLDDLGAFETYSMGGTDDGSIAAYAYRQGVGPAIFRAYENRHWDYLIRRLGNWHLNTLKKRNKEGLKDVI